MSTTPQQHDNQEIDLSAISKKIGLFFENIVLRIFRLFHFLKRNLLVIAILFALGFGLGFYLDRENKIYENRLIVTPNFESVDYLYSKIDLINAKIKERDTIFLKDVVGIKMPKKISKIEIEPLTDVYKFVNNSEKNFEFVKLLAEDGDINKIVRDNLTSKNYPHHLIKFTTSKKGGEDLFINPILNYLNDSEYYKRIQKEFINNLDLKIKANDSIIGQIDAVLNSFKSEVNNPQKNDKLIYYNENTQLNDVIETKNSLVIEQGTNRIAKVNTDKIIKDNSHVLNMVNTDSVNGKLKLVIPLLFILMFIFFTAGVKFYKSKKSLL